MVYVVVQHKVENYNKWKPVFDEHGKTRKQNGSTGATLYRSKDDPNDTLVIMEWDNLENAKKFADSEDLKDTMMKAGVVSQPNVYFLEEVEKSNS